MSRTLQRVLCIVWKMIDLNGLENPELLYRMPKLGCSSCMVLRIICVPKWAGLITGWSDHVGLLRCGILWESCVLSGIKWTGMVYDSWGVRNTVCPSYTGSEQGVNNLVELLMFPFGFFLFFFLKRGFFERFFFPWVCQPHALNKPTNMLYRAHPRNNTVYHVNMF